MSVINIRRKEKKLENSEIDQKGEIMLPVLVIATGTLAFVVWDLHRYIKIKRGAAPIKVIQPPRSKRNDSHREEYHSEGKKASKGVLDSN